LAMMEAAQRQVEIEEELATTSKPLSLSSEKNSLQISQHDHDDDATTATGTYSCDADIGREGDDGGVDDEEEQYNLDRVIGGIATVSGPCGTYAVREPRGGGLAVVPVDPRHHRRSTSTPGSPLKSFSPSGMVECAPQSIFASSPSHQLGPLLSNKHDDQFPHDEQVTVSTASWMVEKADSSEEKKVDGQDHQLIHTPTESSMINAQEGETSGEDQTLFPTFAPYSLKYGQLVQVVDFTDGVATLARGQGFIVAAASQLVKGIYSDF
jgi:hypothetical protein